MIKATELRKGNRLSLDGKVVYVHEIWDDKMTLWEDREMEHVLDSPEEYWVGYSAANLSPIPLTEDFLNEIGIVEQTHGEQWGSSDQRITGFQLSKYFFLQKNLCRDASGNYDGFILVNKTGLVFRSIMGCAAIKTVHRLQNIVYDLTGEELKINKA